LLSAPDRASAQEVATLVVGEYVGAIPLNDTARHDILVAVVANPLDPRATSRPIHAYVCNGEGLTEWFTGDIDGNDFSLTSKGGATITGTMGDTWVHGALVLADAEAHDFAVRRSAGIAGLYHVVETGQSSSGASARGVLLQYAVDDDGRLAGIFLLPDGTIEQVAVVLPETFLAPAEKQSATAEEGEVLATNRVIVHGELPEPQIAGAIKPRAQRCRYYKRIVTHANGTTSEEYVYICS
jgi:hypothetical protein